MDRRSLTPTITILGILAITHITAQEVLASKPNIVLSQAIQFTTPGGKTVMVSPGKYFVEQIGGAQLRLIAEDGSTLIDIQAKSFTHEQYELFSPTAMTRPGGKDLFYVDLLLPGGKRIEATGSTSAPAGRMPTGPSIP